MRSKGMNTCVLFDIQYDIRFFSFSNKVNNCLSFGAIIEFETNFK
jgi:hypothetical protein